MPVEIKYAPPIEADTYEATLTDLQEKVSQKTGGSYRWWQFTLADGRTISSVTGLSFGPRARAGQWAAALLGRTPELGETVELIGRGCLIGVTINDDGFSEVSSLLGRPKGAPSRQAAELAEATDKAEAIHAIQENDPLPF